MFIASFFAASWLEALARRFRRAEAPRSFHLVVLGSSTAAGQGASSVEASWMGGVAADLRARNPAARMTNLALGGAGLYDIMPTGYRPPPARPLPDPARNLTAALVQAPSTVLLSFPTNDTCSGHSAREQLDLYDALAAHARRAGVAVWIATPQPRNLPRAKVATLRAVRDGLLAAFPDRVLDVWPPLALADGTLDPTCDSGDGTHINDEGHARLLAVTRKSGLLASVSPR